MARLSLLAAGVGLLFTALRTTPALSRPLCFVALLPTATFLRSGVTADTVTTALAFLLFATLLSLRNGVGPIGEGDVVLLVLVGASLALAKTGYLPLTWAALALPHERFRSRRARRWSLVLAIGVPVLASVLWMLTLEDWTTSTWHRRADPTEQLRLLVEQPIRLLFVLGATWLSPERLGHLARAFVGRIVVLSTPAFFAPIAVLVVAVLVVGDKRAPSPSLRERVIHAGAALACVAEISLGLYLSWTAPGSPTVRGFQGRYLYPLAPFLLFALLPPRQLRCQLPPRLAAGLVVLVALAMNVYAIMMVGSWLSAR